jgi:DNA primase
VDLHKNLFYCFGCQAGGDLFDFYMLYHNCDKATALHDLASIAGIELKIKNPAQENKLDLLAKFFQDNLLQEHRDFLYARGLTDREITKFKIGFAPSLDQINKFIAEQKLDLRKYNLTSSFWYIFQQRIVFPIVNQGSICSFGGRVLGLDNRSKYINGPKSEFFDKSKVFYSNQKAGAPLYVVEGYLDVILMDKFGYNSVAAMGTSFTKDHLNLALHSCNHLIIAQDGDFAGGKSALKIAYMVFDLIIEESMIDKTIQFLEFPLNEDPASYLQKSSDLSSLKIYEKEEYIILKEMQKAKSVNEQAKVLDDMINIAKKIKNSSLRSLYTNKIRDYWWQVRKENKQIKQRKLSEAPQLLGHDYPVLLLFKYIMLYPDILGQVSELFMKVELDDYLAKQRQNLLESGSLSMDFTERIANLGLQDSITNEESALNAWYSIFESIESESYDLAKEFSENFSNQEWEKLKQLKLSKDKLKE